MSIVINQLMFEFFSLLVDPKEIKSYGKRANKVL